VGGRGEYTIYYTILVKNFVYCGYNVVCKYIIVVSCLAEEINPDVQWSLSCVAIVIWRGGLIWVWNNKYWNSQLLIACCDVSGM
jgi:hypothetical protein